MTRPLLSVIMPVYNGEEYLPSAFDSILAQGRELTNQIEILVVDDGSTDDTLEIVSRYSDRLPLRMIRSHRVGNWVKGLNEGLQAAQGEFCCQLHQDDAWTPDRLTILFSCMKKHPDIDVFLHNALFLSSAGKRIGRWSCPFGSPSRLIQPEVFFRHLLVQDFICINTPIFRTRLIHETGPFDEALKQTTDWDFWLNLFGNYPSYFINKPLSFFRIHAKAQTISHSKDTEDYSLQLERILQRYRYRLNPGHPQDKRIFKAAQFSNLVNASLGQALHQGSIAPLMNIVCQAFTLSPATLSIYLRDSRIIERLGARIRLRKTLKGS